MGRGGELYKSSPRVISRRFAHTADTRYVCRQKLALARTPPNEFGVSARREANRLQPIRFAQLDVSSFHLVEPPISNRRRRTATKLIGH